MTNDTLVCSVEERLHQLEFFEDKNGNAKRMKTDIHVHIFIHGKTTTLTLLSNQCAGS